MTNYRVVLDITKTIEVYVQAEDRDEAVDMATEEVAFEANTVHVVGVYDD